MSEPLIRAYEATIDDVSNPHRCVTSIINTGSVDRYRTVIDPQGMDLEGYRKNPVVLWEHGKDPTRGRLPIGRNQWIKRNGNKLIARTEFGKDDYSQCLFEMYRDGLLRGWSIFALPDERACSKPLRSEIVANPELERCEMVYRKCELGEYSGVAVPGNAETLTLMESRGIWFPEQARSAESEISVEPNREPEPIEEPKVEPRTLPPLEGMTFGEMHTILRYEISEYYRVRQKLVQDTLELIRGRA